MDSFFLFVWNIFINSFLAFFTAVLLIEGIVFLFRIPQGRFVSLLRMIPLLKLPVDVFLYDFSRWSYLHGISPFTCEEGTRNFSVWLVCWVEQASDWFFNPVSGIQFTILNDKTFTVADLISGFMYPLVLNISCVVLLMFSCCFVLKKLLIYHNFNLFLKNTLKSKCKTIRNPFIRRFFDGKQVPVFSSSSIAGSPFVAGVFSSAVYIPFNLFNNLSRKEYEAVLAHEMEHIRHKDNGVRFVLSLIGSFFWWIPTKWLQQLIEEGQEIGCDRTCTKYGINGVDLASAICKSAKNSLILPNQLCAHHLAKHIINKRVNLLLTHSKRRFKKIRIASCCVAATLIFHIVFLGRFWIF